MRLAAKDSRGDDTRHQHTQDSERLLHGNTIHSAKYKSEKRSSYEDTHSLVTSFRTAARSIGEQSIRALPFKQRMMHWLPKHTQFHVDAIVVQIYPLVTAHIFR